jgi:hypothetical protein
METSIPAKASNARPSYFEARRQGLANLLLDYGLSRAIDAEMETGSWAIFFGYGAAKLKQTLYTRGYGWVSGSIGFWADAVVGTTISGTTTALDDHDLLVPGISRDDAVVISHEVGSEAVLVGAKGRYTCIETTTPRPGRDCGWEDVRPAFKAIARWASPSAEGSLGQGRWSFAPPARRIGHDRYEYLFDCRLAGGYSRPPTHFFFSGDVKLRRQFGVEPWAYSTPPLLANYDAWLPLSAV